MSAAERTAPPLSRWRRLWRRTYDGTDRRVTTLAARSAWFRRVAAWLWMPLYSKVGLRFLGEYGGWWVSRLPARRPNRNWYGDMAGSAQLAAIELAAGEPLFRAFGADYVVVCAHLECHFLRPLATAGLVRARIREEIVAPHPAAAFNVTLDFEVLRAGPQRESLERAATTRGGVTAKGEVTFRLMPKSAHEDRPRPLLPW